MSEHLNQITSDKSRKVSINGKDYVIPISTHDRYASRPESLEHMCFAQFSIWYVPMSNQNKKLKLDGIMSDHEIFCPHLNERKCMPLVIKLNDSSLGCMRLRQFPAILKFHKPGGRKCARVLLQ